MGVTYSMKSVYYAEIKRAVISKKFLLSTAGVLAVLIFSAAQDMLQAIKNGTVFEYDYHQQYFLNILGSVTVFFMIPILSALPSTTAFMDDVTSRYIVLYLQRSGKKAYIKAKLAACILSGGGTLLLGTLAFYLVFSLFYRPMEASLTEGQLPPYHLYELLGALGLLFLNGAFCSLLGMLLASLTMSRYVAIACPFIIYYLLVILHERFFPELFVIYPKEWIFSKNCMVLSGFALPLVLLEAMTVIGILFYSYCQKRFRDG